MITRLRFIKSSKFISQLFIIACLLSVTAGLASAAQVIEWLGLDPGIIVVNQPNSITALAKVAIDSALIPSSVTLVRCDASGKALNNIGTLYDDGTHGDVSSGDNIFSSQMVFNETKTGTVYFKSSAAYKGTLKRVFSDVVALSIISAPTPEATLSVVVNDLKGNNYKGAGNSFFLSGKNKDVIMGLDADRASRLAECLANAEFISETAKQRLYRSNYTRHTMARL